MTIDILGNIVTGLEQQVYGTIYPSKNSNDPCYLYCGNLDWFVEVLKIFHQGSYDRKDANKLISPAIFDPNHPKAKGETKRALENIRMMRCLWLDFEEGELQPQQVAELFPLTKLLVFNSYNHSSGSPRFRVVFPFEEFLTPNEYIILHDNIAAKIEDAGYYVKGRKGRQSLPPSGLDISKRTPTSLFYLPCQAKDPADSFLLDHYHDDKRKLLEPKIWIENNVVQFRQRATGQRPQQSAPTAVDQAKVEEARQLWRKSKDHPGEGNERFWLFAVALRSAGMKLEQIETTLKQEADYGRSPDKRKSQIPSIMKSLGQSWKVA